MKRHFGKLSTCLGCATLLFSQLALSDDLGSPEFQQWVASPAAATPTDPIQQLRENPKDRSILVIPDHTTAGQQAKRALYAFLFGSFNVMGAGSAFAIQVPKEATGCEKDGHFLASASHVLMDNRTNSFRSASASFYPRANAVPFLTSLSNGLIKTSDGVFSLKTNPQTIASSHVADTVYAPVDPAKLGNLKPLELGAEPQDRGERLFILGYPAGGGPKVIECRYTGRTLVATHDAHAAYVAKDAFPSMDCDRNFVGKGGFSGGPVINAQGQVVGIISATITDQSFEPNIHCKLDAENSDYRCNDEKAAFARWQSRKSERMMFQPLNRGMVQKGNCDRPIDIWPKTGARIHDDCEYLRLDQTYHREPCVRVVDKEGAIQAFTISDYFKMLPQVSKALEAPHYDGVMVSEKQESGKGADEAIPSPALPSEAAPSGGRKL